MRTFTVLKNEQVPGKYIVYELVVLGDFAGWMFRHAGDKADCYAWADGNEN